MGTFIRTDLIYDAETSESGEISFEIIERGHPETIYTLTDSNVSDLAGVENREEIISSFLGIKTWKFHLV